MRQYFLIGDLARLEMALQHYASDFIDRAYTLVQPPLMMNRTAYEGVTDLSDFETVMYGIEPDGYHLIATSEHPLTAMRMDEIIEPSEPSHPNGWYQPLFPKRGRGAWAFG